jgi:aminoglycoside phosphotransferase (APT) family kinase protein
MAPTQDEWSRLHDFLNLGPKEVAALLRPVVTDGRRILAAEPLTDGLANTNYWVRIEGREEPLVLRLYTRDRDACRKEAALLGLVGDRVPVPRVLHAAPDAQVPYAVTTWVDGVKLWEVMARRDAAAIHSAARSVGQTLAAIASHTFPTAGFFGPDLSIAVPLDDPATSFTGFLEERLIRGRAGERLGRELAERLALFATHNAPRLEALVAEAGVDGGAARLVHADFTPSNILFRQGAAGAWAVSGVLDWEFAFAGSPLFDAGSFLRNENTLPPEVATGFAAGFQEVAGPLPDGWRDLARMLDLLNLVDLLDGPGGSEAVVQRAREIVQATIEQVDGVSGV